MTLNRSLFVLLATAMGCGEAPTIDVDLIDGVGPDVEGGYYIYRGDAPDAWYHDAVVSLHQRTSSGAVYTSPYCSGTLITTEWVITAAHCVQGISASRMAVYVGDDPSVDLSSHVYTVNQVVQHSSYSSSTLRNDIALVKLSTPITESVTPVEPLPSASGFTTSDVGMTLNFAGFGYIETGSYGEKQQVDLPLGGLGCTVSGCTSSGDSATQISYSQTASGGTGPCSGDSGGPAFVFRGTDTYVGGLTSYGDAACVKYGVSTRVDAYESWIAGYTGGSSGGGGTTACSGYDGSYSGTLSAAGDYDYQPDGTYYTTTVRGNNQGVLTGPSGTDFDLYLYKWNSRTSTWKLSASGTTSSSSESVTYNGAAGSYLWEIESYSGSGDYTFCLNVP